MQNVSLSYFRILVDCDVRDECLLEGGVRKHGEDVLLIGETGVVGDTGGGDMVRAGVGGDIDITVSTADCLSSLGGTTRELKL